MAAKRLLELWLIIVVVAAFMGIKNAPSSKASLPDRTNVDLARSGEIETILGSVLASCEPAS